MAWGLTLRLAAQDIRSGYMVPAPLIYSEELAALGPSCEYKEISFMMFARRERAS